MKIILFILIITTVSTLESCKAQLYDSYAAQTQWSLSREHAAKIDEMQIKGSKLRKRICTLSEQEARDLNEGMHKCNQLNHVHQIEELLKQCRNLKTSSNTSSYLEFERQECQYEDCHLRVVNSPEYRRIMQYWEQIPPEERLNKDHQRFKCAMEALGVNND